VSKNQNQVGKSGGFLLSNRLAGTFAGLEKPLLLFERGFCPAFPLLCTLFIFCYSFSQTGSKLDFAHFQKNRERKGGDTTASLVK
jgi:hypothetical protein